MIRFPMTDPDDSRIASRYKYALLVSLETDEAESFLLLATSQLEKAEVFRRYNPDGFHELQCGDYAWVTKPTLVDLRAARCYSSKELLGKACDGRLTFEGMLKEKDLQAIDAKLRASRTIELRILNKIVR